ncbi:MAG: UDP-2,3-diacylglucosamine diphosphatase LpxI [Nitrospirota bacterium]|jgi:DUF1009 family protein
MAAIGLIAGTGELPVLVADEIKAAGHGLVLVALESLTGGALAGKAETVQWFNVGKVGAIVKYLKGEGVTGVVMAGKIPKTLLYRGGVKPDLKGVGILLRLKDRRDDTIINAVAREFEKEGITFLGLQDFLGGLLTPDGKLTRVGPSREQKKDIAFGFRMAKGIGELDIGQTVVVKDRAVMAVEAIEGTDEAIIRGGGLAGGGAVVVKVSRPRQDLRFDIPVVGMETLEAMASVEAAVLALEAGRSIIMQKERFLERAAGAGIIVAGVKED